MIFWMSILSSISFFTTFPLFIFISSLKSMFRRFQYGTSWCSIFCFWTFDISSSDTLFFVLFCTFPRSLRSIAHQQCETRELLCNLCYLSAGQHLRNPWGAYKWIFDRWLHRRICKDHPLSFLWGMK
jgi:hypothetical protein